MYSATNWHTIPATTPQHHAFIGMPNKQLQHTTDVPDPAVVYRIRYSDWAIRTLPVGLTLRP